MLTEKPPVDEDQSMQETDDDDNHNQFLQDVTNFAEANLKDSGGKGETGHSMMSSLLATVKRTTGGNLDALKLIGKDLSKHF